MNFTSKIKPLILNYLLDLLMSPAKSRKGRSPFGAEELKLLRQALLSQNLCCIDGRMVPALEREFAFAYGAPYAVASTSGTAAIHVALGALDLNPTDEVITAPITDLGTIIPILYQNAIPVFADIDETYNMDPADVERKITPQTRAIIVVHLFGNPCNMDAMVDIAKRHNIPLIEDCSQAHMTQYKGRYVGTIGDIGCFSFQQSKHMTTGDGGMTITGNRAYYERMKLFADKGYARKGWGARAYLFHAPNYRMTELVGAVGLAQLKKVRSVVEKRFELGRYLTELLADIPHTIPAPVTANAEHSYWMYPIGLNAVDVDLFSKAMVKEKIHVLPGYTGKPIYLCSESLTAKKTYGDSQWPFSCVKTGRKYEYVEGLCPRAEEALKRLVCLTWDETWVKKDVKRVAETIDRYMRELAKPRLARATHDDSRLVNGGRVAVNEPKHRKVRIGIVGCGQIGRWHLDAYKRNPAAELIAFVDTDVERAEKFAKDTRANVYASHKDMLEAEDLDGVSVCTVPSTHRDIVVDMTKAGVNILCEKPLAVNASQAKEMYESAKSKNLLLLTAFKFRFYDEVLNAKELLLQASLGKILSFRLMFGGYLDMAGSWYAQREFSGGGVVMDNGPHAVDLVRYLFGEIESVSAHFSRHQKLDVEDTAKLLVRMRSDIVGVVDLSWSVSVPSQTYLEIYGENGTIHLDPEGLAYKFKIWKEWKRIHNQSTVKEAFGRQVAHFVDGILGKETSFLGNGEGMKAQLVIDASYESARLGTSVNVSELWVHTHAHEPTHRS